MARGRAKLEWDQTSLLWAQVQNLHRDPDKHRVPFSPADVHPYRTEDEYSSNTHRKASRVDAPIGKIRVIRNDRR